MILKNICLKYYPTLDYSFPKFHNVSHDIVTNS